MGGWNTKSVMPPKLIVVPLRSGHTSISLLYHSYTTPIPLLYHQYHYYTTNITSISFQYDSTVLSAVRLWVMLPTDARELLAIVRQSPAGVGITLFPQPAVLRLWPRRATLSQRYARWPRRISLRDRAQRDRAYTATGGLHTFARTRQRRGGCARSRRAPGEGVARTRNPSRRGNS